MQVSVDVDSTDGDDDSDHYATIPDCSAASPGVLNAWESVAITRLFAVNAGPHTVHLLARKAGGTQAVGASSKSLNVLCVDQDGVGSS